LIVECGDLHLRVATPAAIVAWQLPVLLPSAGRPFFASHLAPYFAVEDAHRGLGRRVSERCSKLGILADWSRRIDIAVLEQGPAEEGERGARDRLFEVLMRRFNALGAYKDALRRLARSARRDLRLACALETIVARSQKWMLVAAGIHKSGRAGSIAIRGAELVYVEVMRIWLDDDDPGLARTMAALDRSLRRGERAMQWLDDVCGFFPRFADRAGRRRRQDRGEGAEAEA